jgi:hypothetical protein
MLNISESGVEREVYRKKINSHISEKNNLRLIGLMEAIDKSFIIAFRNMTAQDINDYFNFVELFYINIKDAFINTELKEVELIRGEIHNNLKKISESINTNAKGVTKQSFFPYLISIKKFHGTLISVLQNKEFFFRIGKNNNTSLDKINYGYGSVYGE